MLINVSTLLISLILMGCGADSDLLTDNSVGKSPNGNAYKALNERLYSYNIIDDRLIGFEYFSINEECNTNECSLVEDSYALFNNESKKLNQYTKLILGPNGWFEASSNTECSVVFNGNKLIEYCPDGRESAYIISEENLENKPINELNSSIIRSDMLKDSQATFTKDSKKYMFKIEYSDKYFETLNNESSICSTSMKKQEAPVDNNLSNFNTITCTIDDFTFVLQDLDKPNGMLNINSLKDKGNWQKNIQYNRYYTIELNASEIPKQYFISQYNNTVRIGTVIEQEYTKSYINTEAFNVIYSQLQDTYKAESQTYTKLQENYYQIGIYSATQGYKQFFIDSNDKVNIVYKDFLENDLSANWILSDIGLKRESLVCNNTYYFDSYIYDCEDGRKGEVSYVGYKELKNDLISTYSKDYLYNFSFENEYKFFSSYAKELTFKHKNNSGETYIFNLDNRHVVGNDILESNAVTLSSDTLYITNREHNSYIKLLDINLSDEGVAKLYKKDTTLDENTTLIDNALFLENTIWTKIDIGDYSLIRIANTPNIEQAFKNSEDLALIEFMLDTPRVISGTLYDTGIETTKRYLNLEAYEDILNNIN